MYPHTVRTFLSYKKCYWSLSVFPALPISPKGHTALPPIKHRPAPRRVNCPFLFLLVVPTPSSHHIHHFWIHSLEPHTSSRATHSSLVSAQAVEDYLLSRVNALSTHTRTRQDSHLDGCPGTPCCRAAAAMLQATCGFDVVSHSYQRTHCSLRQSVRGRQEECCIYPRETLRCFR